MYEGELTALYADTNLGKSIFAIQMGEAIAEKGFKTLYVDGILSFCSSGCASESILLEKNDKTVRNQEIIKFIQNGRMLSQVVEKFRNIEDAGPHNLLRL